MPAAKGLHLSVDGMTPSGPNLSHWPGNRTPAAWKADLSTGICLNFSRADAAEQKNFLGDASVVLNDHYDTDGFCSLLAILHPEVAQPREELLLLAAATGDFGLLHTWRGFAIDRIVSHLASPASPVAAEFHNLSGAEKCFARYQWLLANARLVLDQPEHFAALYKDELALIRGQIDAGLRGAVALTHHRDLGFAILATTGNAHRMTLNTLAGAYRVMHLQNTADGPLYRFHDRTESWFEMVTKKPPLRRDLRPLAKALNQIEPPQDGAQWCADAPTEPIPEIYFGPKATQQYGEDTRQLRSSRLPRTTVEGMFVTHFCAAPTL
ncbi:MAG: DUF6687 family protein [Planctomycetota bacterium]|nr:hypothetical protein [Planctomycetota bacterium]MSR39953.1 hypothetical protein [Planctomycetota bacterium]